MKKVLYLLCCCIIMLGACKSEPAAKKELKDQAATKTQTQKKEPVKPTPTENKMDDLTARATKVLSKIDAGKMKAQVDNAKFDKDLTAVIKTSKGDINLDLYATKTPKTVANLKGLAEAGYYDGLNFHRVLNDFMIQGGCPRGDGRGNPGYFFDDEFRTDLKHDSAGILSMANSGTINGGPTNGSQFFITHKATNWLDGKHTVFGKVKSQADMDVVNKITQGDVIKTIIVK